MADEAVLGTMTVHLYMRAGNSGLTEIGSAEIDVTPTLMMNEALADIFEQGAIALRAQTPDGEETPGG